MFSKIGRVLFHGNHGACPEEGVIWVLLWCSKSDSFVGIESLGEVIGIHNSENSLVNVQVHSDVEVFPGVSFWLLSWDEDLVSLKENTLRNARVLDAVLKDVKGIIIKIVVHCAFTDTVILVGILHNRLLEVSLEV